VLPVSGEQLGDPVVDIFDPVKKRFKMIPIGLGSLITGDIEFVDLPFELSFTPAQFVDFRLDFRPDSMPRISSSRSASTSPVRQSQSFFIATTSP
jgi:hypothetical protein